MVLAPSRPENLPESQPISSREATDIEKSLASSKGRPIELLYIVSIMKGWDGILKARSGLGIFQLRSSSEVGYDQRGNVGGPNLVSLEGTTHTLYQRRKKSVRLGIKEEFGIKEDEIEVSWYQRRRERGALLRSEFA